MNGKDPKVFSTWCDWVTIATYKLESYTDLAAYLRRQEPTGWKGGTWLQYKGYRNKDINTFYGSGDQSNKKTHYICVVSGSWAGQWLPDFLAQPFAEQFYCTRLDVEKTRVAPSWWEPRKVKDRLGKLNITTSMVESDTGSTVYIGSRRSGRFIRMYEKDYGRKYVRLEIELKRHYARMAWEALLQGANIADIYATHLDKCKLPDGLTVDFMPSEYDPVNLTYDSLNTDMQKKWEWLLSLSDTFLKMANDHEYGERTRALFLYLSTPTEVEGDDID